MNESLDQQAGHSPAPSTGSRQLAELRQRYVDEQAEARAQRALQPGKALGRDLGGLPLHRVTLMPGVADLNGIGAIDAQVRRAASVVCALRAC